MPVEDLAPGEQLGLARGDLAVCIPVYGGYELFARCLDSVLRHTDSAIPVLICDDGSPEPRVRDLADEALIKGHAGHRLVYLRQSENLGFVVNVNSGFAALVPADVVILNSDCVVTEGWLEGLGAAAYSDERVATVTTMTNAGTIVSVPFRNQPMAEMPEGNTIDGFAGAIRARSERLLPDLPTCIGHCVYVRRSALDLVGPFDESFSPGYEEEVDFSQRCLQHGLRHILADDVFVFHGHSGTFGRSQRMERLRAEHHQIIVRRYPYFDNWVAEVAEDPNSPLARSVAGAARSTGVRSVTIDGRSLIRVMTGTALATLELISALDRHTDLRLRVLIPEELGDYAADVVFGREGIEPLPAKRLFDRPGRTDVVHRPYQVQTFRDPLVLRTLGQRVVVTQQDNIAFRNPAYHGTYKEWLDYRRVTVTALASSDQVVFVSRHGAHDARILGLVEENRINVIPEATDHTVPELYSDRAEKPHDLPADDRPFLFCLGTDFMHKNRLFAIRLLESLRAQGRFDGRLLFAGPKVDQGSSDREEADYLAARPELAAHVTDLGPVAEAEKTWLLNATAAVVYPTTYEGFGLVPFEAARVGTPCLFAWHTSLADQLPRPLARLIPWDPELSAAACAPVLAPGPEREALVKGVRMAGARLTSARQAQQHAEVYERALHGSSPAAGILAGEILELETELDHIYGDPLNRALAGRYAVLPSELRRPVLAIATRPWLRVPASLLYKTARAFRNGSRESMRKR